MLQVVREHEKIGLRSAESGPSTCARQQRLPESAWGIDAKYRQATQDIRKGTPGGPRSGCQRNGLEEKRPDTLQGVGGLFSENRHNGIPQR